MFRLVSNLYPGKTFYHLKHTGLVYDQSLQKAGVDINSAAKKLGQPSAEIHADPASAAKQKEASHGGMVGLCLLDSNSSALSSTRLFRSFTVFLWFLAKA